MKPTCAPGPIEPEEIVQLLKKEVTENTVTNHIRSTDPSYNGNPGMHDRGWKEVVYSALEDFVRKHGGRAVFTRTKKKEREFMLDFVGLDDKDKNQAFRGAMLGVECEWWKTSEGREELLRNFRKLLFFKAPLKLLVYGDCPAKCRAEVRETLRDSLRKFEDHVKGECYLLIEFYKENRLYKQEGHVWCAEQDGPAPEATFRNVGEISFGT
jgi:hypothetical protein